MQTTKSGLNNPYTLPLQDARREYRQLFDKKVWNFEDIHRMEKLMIKIDRLRLLVRVYDAR